MTGKLLVAGASGLVGRAVIDHFERLGDWEIVGLSRRPPMLGGKKAQHVAVDLADTEDCRAKLAGLSGVTHIVYTALFEKPDLEAGWIEPDHMATNLKMFANFFDAVEPGNRASLRHVSLLQGAKAYGVHLGPAKIPGREVEPRHIHPNFYWLQEDHLKAARVGKSWSYTIFRPQFVFGFTLGSPMNVLSAIAVYAWISKELGLPLVYPGKGGPAAIELTDVRILASAIAWAGRSSAAIDRAFNVTNGDVIIWEHAWPEVAKRFDIRVGAPHPMSLATVMPSKEKLWTAIQSKYGLEPFPYSQIVGPAWQFADMCFGFGQNAPHSMLSTIQIRKAGFHNCVDSIDMLSELFEELEDKRIIPRAV
jgi:nucleoside-diphosphate-sugar epimerase